MEANVQKLIDQIKQDGIAQAQAEASKIIKDANAKAEEIIKKSQAEAQSIIENARKETDLMRKASETALKQAARDTLLTLRTRVGEFFARVVKDKVSEQLTPETLNDIIKKAIELSVAQGVADIEIILSETDRQALEKILFSALKKEARENIQLKESKDVKGGFRIGAKGTGSYLDFTDQAIAEGFRRYLNPKLSDALDIDLGLKQESGDGR